MSETKKVYMVLVRVDDTPSYVKAGGEDFTDLLKARAQFNREIENGERGVRLIRRSTKLLCEVDLDA